MADVIMLWNEFDLRGCFLGYSGLGFSENRLRMFDWSWEPKRSWINTCRENLWIFSCVETKCVVFFLHWQFNLINWGTLYPLAGYKQWTGRSVCAREEGKVEHLFRKTLLHCIPCIAWISIGKEREDPSRELGEMFNASDRFVAVYLDVRSGCDV